MTSYIRTQDTQHGNINAEMTDDAATAAPQEANPHRPTGTGGRGLRMGQTAAFRAFRALRQLRPDRAYGLLGNAGHTRVLNSTVLAQLQKNGTASSASGQHQAAVRGRKRQAAKRALRAAYHGMMSMTVLPIAYVVAAAFPEGHATAGTAALKSLANAPGNALSRWFGYFAGTRRLPASVHHRMIRMMVRVYGIDTSQVEKPVEAYPTLQDFFSRRLVSNARPPHPTSILVSPCDGEVLRVGRMDSHSHVILQVKGNEYPVEQLIAAPMPAVAAGYNRWFFLFHLRPKDYHRFHAPCDAQVMEAIHVPGCLFPVTQTAAKWIPNLFAESERVAVLGRRTADGQPLAFVPMGATCVGSISLAFDTSLKTNSISSLTNLKSLFQWRPRQQATTTRQAARVPLLGSGWEFATPAASGCSLARQSADSAQASALVAATDPSATPTAAEVPFVTSPWSCPPTTAVFGSSPHEATPTAAAPLVASPLCTVLHATSDLAACPVQRHSHFAAGNVQRRVYPCDAQPTVQRGLEMGWFNWGSAILMVTDLPEGIVPCVRDHQEVRVGQALCAPLNEL